MKPNFTYLWLLIAIFFSSEISVAQKIDEQPTDDLGDVSDAFQENFFEALKQKGIENYELALAALQKAERAAKKNPDYEAVVYFEMGKNLKSLEQYTEAEDYLKQVLSMKGERLDVMEVLYDLYYQQRAYNSAIPLVQKLIKIDEDYKEDLANLYHRTKQYNKALSILDELDETWGESVYRNSLRRQIYRVTGDSEGAIKNLETKIDANPKNEQDYLNLIFLYSEEGETGKAFETAKALLENQPNSELVHLALYKFYLDEGNTTDARNSMKKVFRSTKIDKENKYKVLSDYIDFVTKNPEYESDLDEIVSVFSSDGNGQVYEQLGGYYVSQDQKETALRFYEQGARKDPDNFSLIKNTLLLHIDLKNFQDAISLSEEALGVFPAQPILYLINGVSNNQLSNNDEAIDMLEMGLEFLFDNPTMEKDFYEQLSAAYMAKGNTKKAEEYTRKASEIKLSN